jgi:hypothetical protein
MKSHETRGPARADGTRARALLAGALLASLIPAAAAAYILPPRFVIKKMVEARGKLGILNLAVDERYTVRGGDGGLKTSRAVETISAPSRWRTEIELKSGAYEIVRRGDRVRTGGETATEPLDVLTVLFAAPRGDVDFIVDHLHRLGVDLGARHLSRFAGRIAIVIGANQGDDRSPQLWVDKDRFLPLRFIAPVKIGGKDVVQDTRLLEYGSPATGDWFPRVIEVYRGGELLSRRVAEKVRVNQSIPDDLFEIEPAKAKAKAKSAR